VSNLHPKVSEFKAFVERHPNLIKHVRKNKDSWQPYYEKWLLYGEDDDYWDTFSDGERKKSEDKSSKNNNQELFSKLSGMVNNLDLNKLQDQMNQLSGVITNVQSLLQQYQESKQQNPFQKAHGNRPNPFKFGKD
jgi:hypothetical protein